jgi:hypothetical protein
LDQKSATKDVRRYNSYLGSVNTNYNALLNPWIPTLWSFAFPGFGHFLLGMYIEGYLLVIWEIFVNCKAYLNEAMLYSFTGQFEKSKEILSLKWGLLYIAVYVFSVWDSYRSAVDTNKYQVLAEREKSKIVPYVLSSFSFNYLEKISPPVSALWSMFMPGLGHILIHRIPTGIFMIIWWITICYYSNMPLAAYYTATGSFHKAISIVDPQWFLFMPSIFCFVIYDTYFTSVELNKLFKLEQAFFLKKEYQNKNFKIPWK